ncbi:MAG: insulinase family protein [Helicobacteraceae bacterium]|jgi:predicted Zn-dependent peptidase|nr:insulinase family protein [Helicobacteraceae bacterium]
MKKIAAIWTITIGVLMAHSLPQIEIQTLKNGLTVAAVAMNNDTGVISVDIFYKVGSRNEIMGKSGIAHMLEHMNFKSSKNLEAGEFDRIVKGFGGVTNASTGFDYTHYFIKTATQNLDRSLELFAELMQNLNLKDEEFQPERKVVYEERRWRTENSPIGTMYFELFNLAFSRHPYHWTPIGFANDIESWTIDDIKEFHSLWYQPQNAILLVAGDFKPQELFKLAEKRFGGIKNKSEIKEIDIAEPEQRGARRSIINKESEVETLMIAWKIPAFDDGNITAINALASLLSEGASSRLQERLVDKLRYVNAIGAYAMEGRDPSLFVVTAICNPGIKAEEVEKEILDQIAAIVKKAPSQKEVDKVKIMARSEFIQSLESSDSLAGIFGDYLAKENLTPLLNYEKEIEALNAKAIQAAAAYFLVADRSTTIILRNK